MATSFEDDKLGLDLLSELAGIQKRGVALSEDLIHSIGVIALSKGTTIQIVMAAVMWDYVQDFNHKQRKDLLDYQYEREKIAKGPYIRKSQRKPRVDSRTEMEKKTETA